MQALQRIDWEVLPFQVDPLKSLHPDGEDARTDGNVGEALVKLQKLKWTKDDFDQAEPGKLPMGKAAHTWDYGDVDAGFARAKLILDETFVHASNSHHSMEPRTAMAYWQNGKCFAHVSSQSQSFIHPALAGMIGIPPTDLVLIAEYCGGGFGSKGGAYPIQALPALMSKKINRPVMLRISRAEEYYHGSARLGFQGRVKLGFDEKGKLLAADLYVIQENGAVHELLRLPQRRRRALPRLSARGHALAWRAGVRELAAAQRAARSRLQPARTTSWSR